LTLASYEAGANKSADVEPLSVGMTAMPLFLHPGRYVLVPLEETYQTAWAGVPKIFRDELERPAE
jgi:hypothetical protein